VFKPAESAPSLYTAAGRQSARQVFWLSDHPIFRTFPSDWLLWTVVVADFVLDHSGGTTPELHGIPY